MDDVSLCRADEKWKREEKLLLTFFLFFVLYILLAILSFFSFEETMVFSSFHISSLL